MDEHGNSRQPTVSIPPTQDSPAGPSTPRRTPAVDATTLPVRSRTRYDLLEVQGQGGGGRVWRARDRELDRIVALKELVVQDPASRLRFEREALVTARLEHPAIVPVHEAGHWDSGEPFYVMKLVSGRTLAEVAGKRRTLAERLELLPSLLAVADAMAYAHAQGVLHRDLKPANVLVGDFGETVVIDWGLAKDLNAPFVAGVPDLLSGSPDGGTTEVGSVMGTPSFMAPEQARGEAVDERADVYAIGGLLYYVLSARTPLAGRTPKPGASSAEMLKIIGYEPPAPILSLEPGVSPDLAAIVNKAMAQDAAQRYPSAPELALDLKRFQTGQLVRAHEYSSGELLRRWVRRHKGLTIATALFALCAAIFVTAFVVREKRLRHAAELERDRADEKSLALLEQQGRDELAAGHPFQAAPYLVEAYRRNPKSLALRALVSQTIRPMERLDRLALGHTNDVPYVDYSPDGTRFVTASSDGTARIWSAGDAHELAVLRGGDQYLDTAVFSPDGKLVATGGNRGLHVFRADTGELVHVFEDHDAYRIWFTPDGKSLIQGSQSGEVRLYDAETGEIKRSVQAHKDRVYDLAFSPDGTRFAIASWDSTVSIWDTASFQVIQTLADHDAEVASVAYSRDGQWLLTVESDVNLHIRRADTGARVRTLRLPEGARFAHASFSPDGLTIVTRAQDGGVRTYDAASGALLDAFDAQPYGKLMASALRPDGLGLVTVGLAGYVAMWKLDAKPAYRLLHHPLDHGDYGLAAFTRDGQHVFTGEEDGTVDEWSAASGAFERSWKVPGNAFAMEPNGDGTRVAVIGTMPANLPPRLWDPTTGQEVATLPAETARLMTHLAVSADGHAFALTSYDGTVRLFNADSGAPESVLRVDSLRMTAVAFRPDGRELAAANEHGVLYFLDRASGTVVRTVQAHATWIQDVAYSADGTKVVTAGRQDHTAKVWDARTGELVLVLNGHTDNLMHAGFSPDGSLIATAAMDHRAIVWDAASGEIIRTLVGPNYAADFSPDGTELFTTGNHGYAGFWDLRLDPRSADELATFVAERSPWMLEGGRLRLRNGTPLLGSSGR